MTLPPRTQPARVVFVGPLALLLAVWTAWDGGGFAFSGPRFNTSPSYEALQIVPWGMRAWGVILLGIALAITYGLGRERSGNARPLNLALGLGVGFHTLWSFVLVGTWVDLGYIPAWGALGKSLGLIALFYLCGRGAAPKRDHR